MFICVCVFFCVREVACGCSFVVPFAFAFMFTFVVATACVSAVLFFFCTRDTTFVCALSFVSSMLLCLLLRLVARQRVHVEDVRQRENALRWLKACQSPNFPHESLGKRETRRSHDVPDQVLSSVPTVRDVGTANSICSDTTCPTEGNDSGSERSE